MSPGCTVQTVVTHALPMLAIVRIRTQILHGME
jgi:hypothetical protein